MKICRIKYAANVFTLFTGVVFLNMSFLLAEISALDLAPNNPMAVIANSIAEEDPEAEENPTFAELDFIINQCSIVRTIGLYSNNKFDAWALGHPRQGEFAIDIPPPQAYFF